jgi:hypothetical protein
MRPNKRTLDSLTCVLVAYLSLLKIVVRNGISPESFHIYPRSHPPGAFLDYLDPRPLAYLIHRPDGLIFAQYWVGIVRAVVNDYPYH